MLAKILGKKQASIFFRDYWCRKPVVLKPALFPKELTITESQIYQMYLLHGEDHHTYTSFNESEPGKKSDRNRLKALFSDKRDKMHLLRELATNEALIMRDLATQKRWDHLCREVDSFMKSKCTLNCYLIKRGADHFPLHQDPHHILAFQAQGKKRWYMWEPSTIAPMRNYKWKKEPHWIENPTVFEVNKGEIMYLPLGWRHMAETIDDVSIHFSLGLHNIRWVNLIQDLVEMAGSQHYFLRENVPFVVGSDGASYRKNLVDEYTGEILKFLIEGKSKKIAQLIKYYNQKPSTKRRITR